MNMTPGSALYLLFQTARKVQYVENEEELKTNPLAQTPSVPVIVCAYNLLLLF